MEKKEKLNELKQLATEYSDAENKLTEVKNDLQDELNVVFKKYRSKIKNAAEKVVNAKDALNLKLSDCEDLFESPKSMVLSGIKVGYKKGKDSLTVSDTAHTIRMIKEKYKGQDAVIKLMITTVENPNLEAIKGLDADTLKELGCSWEKGENNQFITPVDGEVDKFIKKLADDTDKKQAA